MENLDPLRYNVQNGNGRGSAPQSPKSVTTPVSHCSTEPMEVVSRGDSSSGQKTSHSSNEVGGRMGEEVVVCRLYDKGGVGVADWMEKAISGDRSSDMMDAPMEAGHNADSSSSQRSESEKTMTTPNLDSADDPKLYKLFAISVSYPFIHPHMHIHTLCGCDAHSVSYPFIHPHIHTLCSCDAHSISAFCTQAQGMSHGLVKDGSVHF